MGAPQIKPATYDDVLAAPEHMVAEVLAGQLHLSPRPAGRHAFAASLIGGELSGPFHRGRGGPGGWLLLDEPELHLGAEPAILVPDLAGWRRERLGKSVAEFVDTPFFTLAPDWVCEVLSPSTGRFDRQGKMGLYAAQGVKHAWLVDPAMKTLEVFRNEGGKWLVLAVHAGEEKVRAEPFDAIELELGALWG